MEKLGYSIKGDRYHTLDGTFWLTREDEGVHVHGESPVFGQAVTVRVTGFEYTDLALSVQVQRGP